MASIPIKGRKDCAGTGRVKIGDYVLASRWSDRDPHDPWFVGHVAKVEFVRGRFFVWLMESGRSWPHCWKITAEIGEKILKQYGSTEIASNTHQSI